MGIALVRCEVALGFETLHVQSYFADDGLRRQHADSVDAREIHSRDPDQFSRQIELRCVPCRLLPLPRRQRRLTRLSRLSRPRRKVAQMPFDFLVALPNLLAEGPQ